MAIQINGNGTITGISVGGLPDGIVDTDMIAASAVTAAKSTGLGINMVDRWHLETNFNINSANTNYQINTGWAKSTSSGYNSGSLGSAMTQSSGVFTFPSTGIYYIVYDCITGTSNDQLNMWSYIAVGADGTATNYLSVKASSGDSGTMNSVTGSALLDVTDTSTQKINVRAYHSANGSYISSNSNGQRTTLTFIRLGDT